MVLSVLRMFLVFCSSWMVSAWAARSSRELAVPSPTSPRKSTSFWAFRVCHSGGWREGVKRLRPGSLKSRCGLNSP